MGVSHGNLNMTIAPYRYNLKRTAKLWGSLMAYYIYTTDYIAFLKVKRLGNGLKTAK